MSDRKENSGQEWFQKHKMIDEREETLKEVKADYELAGLEHFELFWDNKPVNGLNKAGLFCV